MVETVYFNDEEAQELFRHLGVLIRAKARADTGVTEGDTQPDILKAWMRERPDGLGVEFGIQLSREGTMLLQRMTLRRTGSRRLFPGSLTAGYRLQREVGGERIR
jgi:hypothetical protein